MSKLAAVDRMYLENLLEMGGGYVLSFSNATFADFVRASTGEEIYSDSYVGETSSKASRLRAFWSKAPDDRVAVLLRDLLTLMIDNEKIPADGPDAARVRRIIEDLSRRQGKSAEKLEVGRTTERRAFVSYSVERKVLGGAVKSCLTEFGYQCFLAHDDLRVSDEWKHKILDELGIADVFVALLSKEFMASKWCGQELGFILSRPDVLVVPLSIDGTMPYGFIGHLQGTRVDDGNLGSVLEEVLYRKRPQHMIPAQIERVRSASSYRRAEALVRPLVPHFALFSNGDVDAFAHAVASNPQVWDASLCGSEYIPEFVRVNGARMSREAAQGLLGVLPDLELPR